MSVKETANENTVLKQLMFCRYGGSMISVLLLESQKIQKFLVAKPSGSEQLIKLGICIPSIW